MKKPNICPIERIKLKGRCKVATCQYYSCTKLGCGYEELHCCDADGPTVAKHKGLTLKEVSKIVNETRKKAKYIVILDEYLIWAHNKFKRKLVPITHEVINEVTEQIQGSLLCKLPSTVYVQLLPFLINQDVLDEFLKLKDLDSISVNEVMIDIDVVSIKKIFAEEQILTSQ